jgi:inosose dehydratase
VKLRAAFVDINEKGKTMSRQIDRRSLLKTAGLAAGALCAGTDIRLSAAGRRLKIGYTSITWGFGPKAAEPGIRDSAALGYHGYESFDNVLEVFEEQGGLGQLLDKYGIRLVSSYFNANLTNPDVRKDEVAKIVRWGKLLRKYGGLWMVIGPNPVRRGEYDFNAARPAILAALNEIGMAAADLGLKATIHQHTDTCIDTRDQVYSVLNAVDTRYMGFGPDVGQLAKAGSDPVQVVKDFALHHPQCPPEGLQRLGALRRLLPGGSGQDRLPHDSRHSGEPIQGPGIRHGGAGAAAGQLADERTRGGHRQQAVFAKARLPVPLVAARPHSFRRQESLNKAHPRRASSVVSWPVLATPSHCAHIAQA